MRTHHHLLIVMTAAFFGVTAFSARCPKVGLCADPEETPATKVKDSAGEKKIAWGKETKGLVANLRALKTAVKPGEPIEFEIRVKNVSKKDVRLYSGRGGERRALVPGRFALAGGSGVLLHCRSAPCH